MVSLGLDLETEILVWLPLKSLIRFRCVQRSWNDLIQKPTFMKRRQMNMSDSQLLILYKKEPYVTLLSCDNLIHIKSLFSNKTLCNYHTIESYGSCNGVFCLKRLHCSHKSCLDELIMWNPTTREVHRVPPSLFLDKDPCLHGFGADDPNNISFKVVKLHLSYDGIRRSAEVYNLSTNSWTPTEHPPPFTEIRRLCPSRYNTLVNSVYHWITNISFYDVANILCFDFRNNQFHELRGPTFSVEDHNFLRDDVAEIKGSLAYVIQHRFDSPVVSNIWVMDQSGWHKKYNIGPLVSISRMLGLWKNGDERSLEESLVNRSHHMTIKATQFANFK
jgi:F-box interacting protein